METLTFPMALLTHHLATALHHVVKLSFLHVEKSVGRLLIQGMALLSMIVRGHLHGNIGWLGLLFDAFHSI